MTWLAMVSLRRNARHANRRWFAKFFAAMEDYRVRRATIRDLRSVDAHMLRDIGITPEDVPDIARRLTERRRAAITGTQVEKRRLDRPAGPLGNACCQGL